jgi:hypothetical protein
MTATKDMWVANLVEPWKEESNSIPVIEFFESINEAAEMGRMSSKDKVRLATLKLRGAARTFYSAQPQLRADGISYEEFRTILVNRFQDKHTAQYHYARMQNASQEKNESPEVFLDLLRKLCQRTIRSSANPVEQAVINQEADRRLLAAFINGLLGAVGKQVRMQMPDNIDKALNMATVAANAEKEEKALTREDRGTNARVFTVGGSRGGAPSGRYDKSRRRFQGSNRGGWSQYRAEPIRNTTRVVGTYSRRTDNRTPMQSEEQERTMGGGAVSGPKNDDDRYASRPRGIQCYNCGLMGHIRSNCPRGQKRNLNGIGRTKMTPPSGPK